VKGPIPSPLPVLLPLEKGLRVLAFVPDYSSKRPGQQSIPGLSASPTEPATTGLEEIGGSTGAESERSKIFAV
jgi:hypothetical protein